MRLRHAVTADFRLLHFLRQRRYYAGCHMLPLALLYAIILLYERHADRYDVS